MIVSKDNCTQALPEYLPAPVFRLANENNATNPKSKVATPLDFRPYAGMQMGDILSLHFRGFDELEGGENIEAAEFQQTLQIIDYNIKKGFDLFIPGRILYAIGLGRAEVYIEVIRGAMTSRSETVHVLVDMREGNVFRPDP